MGKGGGDLRLGVGGRCGWSVVCIIQTIVGYYYYDTSSIKNKHNTNFGCILNATNFATNASHILKIST